MGPLKQLLAADLPKLGGFDSGLFQRTETPDTRLAEVLSNIVAVLTIFGGLAFLAWFVIGALTWASSGGNQEQLNKAKSQMSTAVAGLFVLILATSVVWILGKITGLEILNLEELINKVTPGTGGSGSILIQDVWQP